MRCSFIVMLFLFLIMFCTFRQNNIEKSYNEAAMAYYSIQLLNKVMILTVL